jgi:hypothetical protein
MGCEAGFVLRRPQEEVGWRHPAPTLPLWAQGRFTLKAMFIVSVSDQVTYWTASFDCGPYEEEEPLDPISLSPVWDLGSRKTSYPGWLTGSLRERLLGTLQWVAVTIALWGFCLVASPGLMMLSTSTCWSQEPDPGRR